MEGKIHELKTLPEYFEEVRAGNKNFEIRKNDRNFTVGDTLILKEYIPLLDKFTGAEITKKVNYILKHNHRNDFGLKKGYVILSIK